VKTFLGILFIIASIILGIMLASDSSMGVGERSDYHHSLIYHGGGSTRVAYFDERGKPIDERLSNNGRTFLIILDGILFLGGIGLLFSQMSGRSEPIQLLSNRKK
jgi:hypothetical protein